MAPPTDRSQILFNFRREIDDGKALVGAGAGKLILQCLSAHIAMCVAEA